MRAIASMLQLSLLSTGAVASTIAPPPQIAVGGTVDTIQGVAVKDPYRALENPAGPSVKAWSDAENARTRAYLDALPGRAAVAAKLGRMIKDASSFSASLQPRGDAVFALHDDPAKQQLTLVVMAASADPATARAIVDPNAMDPAGHTAIDWFAASPDGKLVAVSISENGSEDGTLHVYDAATGKEVGEPISRVQFPTAGGAVGWAADGRGFWYTRYPGEDAPEAERHFNLAVWFHRMGTPIATDTLALSAKDGVPRTGEIFMDDRSGGAAVLASVQLGDGGQWRQFVLRQDKPALMIADYGDQVVAGAIARDGTVFGLSRKDAPMGKVLKLAAPYTGGFAHAATIVPAVTDAAIIDGGARGTPLAVAGGHLLVTRISGGPNTLTAYDLAGGHETKLPTPEVASVNEVDPLPNGDALYMVATYTQPPRYLRWSVATGRASPTAIAMTSPVSYADVTVTRIFATSNDGTKVPVTVMLKTGTTLDGSHPLLLYGYGGYGSNQTPTFSGGFRRVWLDAGGIYAIANIRGGGEYGDVWHKAGMLTKKQNVFDDFAAAAQTLIARGYTNREKLAFQGGSNGGLLMGAEITQHPDLPRAVVSEVGMYDMLRVELDPNGAFNTTEFGTVKDPAQFRALYAYSPYHHVVAGTRYPAVFMATGANDGRVNPFHSRKFTAALQAAQAAPDRPILLRTSENAGHGIGSSLDDIIAERTDELMFLFDQLGMDATAAAK